MANNNNNRRHHSKQGHQGNRPRGPDQNRSRPNRGNNRDRDRDGPRRDNSRHQQNQPQQPRELPADLVAAPKPPKKYGILFYDSFVQAKNAAEELAAKAKEFDQLNIVIKAEGDQNDPDLIKYGKLFAGEAWHLIHTRRVADGWYNEPR